MFKDKHWFSLDLHLWSVVNFSLLREAVVVAVAVQSLFCGSLLLVIVPVQFLICGEQSSVDHPHCRTNSSFIVVCSIATIIGYCGPIQSVISGRTSTVFDYHAQVVFSRCNCFKSWSNCFKCFKKGIKLRLVKFVEQ